MHDYNTVYLFYTATFILSIKYCTKETFVNPGKPVLLYICNVIKILNSHVG